LIVVIDYRNWIFFAEVTLLLNFYFI